MFVFYRKPVTLLLGLLIISASGCRPSETAKTPLKPPYPTRENLLGVSSPDFNHIWAVGLNATILYSADAGENWVNQKCPLETDFYEVMFIDSQHGWVVGKYGTILQTNDGGEHWLQQKSPTDQRLFDVFFVDDKTGWVVGSRGTILFTADGGKTWQQQGFGEDRKYNGVWFVDNRKGWIVGEYGTILHTDNGGSRWIKQQCTDIIPIIKENEWEVPTPSLYGVYFQDYLKGWAVGLDGIIIATEDGGSIWKKLNSPSDQTLYKIMVIENNGWTVGLRGNYVISTDGGITWQLDENAIKTKFWFRDLCFNDNRNGWVVGCNGTLARTEDGGKTFKIVSGVSMN